MLIARDLPALRAAVRALRPAPVALVPTMGALHRGHAALLDAARASGAAVVASVFVNPLQFATGADAAAYPRDEATDLALLAENGCAVAWLPTDAAMYPPGSVTRIVVGGPAEGFEGAARPGHFEGVATVVAKLFAQVQPDTAYFGEKDWQQVQVVRRLVADLDLPVGIAVVPTVRDADGLALSSRNRFLSAAQREAARALPAALLDAAAALRGGATFAPVREAASAALGRAGFEPDYFALIDGATMRPLETAAASARARLIAAARLGPVRLLDTRAIAG